ncbi:MAG: DUF2987 domain-containing protein [Pseudomonadota bacterium]|nr:DUF2987 domain-containing protein [Pseudomonadota bacterium]
MQRLVAWLMLVTVLVAGGARADEWREIPYKDLARIQAMLEKVDNDRVFSGKFSVIPVPAKQALPRDLRVEVLVGGKAIAVQVDPDGRMHLPIRQDWIDAGASVRINQPKDALTVSYTFRARAPEGTRMRYSQLAESAEVMARGIDAEAGLLSFIAPKPHALDLRFEQGPLQVLTIRFADGTSKTWRAVAKRGHNAIELPWKPEWRDAEVMLSAPLGGVIPLVK